jgi:hypothetical protein
MTREQAATVAMEKIGLILDDYFRGNLTHASAFFEIATIRTAYEARS